MTNQSTRIFICKATLYLGEGLHRAVEMSFEVPSGFEGVEEGVVALLHWLDDLKVQYPDSVLVGTKIFLDKPGNPNSSNAGGR